MSDELRPIPGWPNYSITIDGRVWSDEKFRRKGDGWAKQYWRGGQSGDRYLCVCFRENGKVKWWPVHHLVLEVFKGPRPPGMQGLHKDDDSNNNHLDNLDWGTPTQNNRMRKCVKLTDQDAWQILVLYYEQKMIPSQIALQFGLHKQSVWHILYGDIWSDVHARYMQSRQP